MQIFVFCSERMSRLLVPFADQYVEIPSMTAGNIALTVGLKQVNFFFFLLYFEELSLQIDALCMFIYFRLSQETPLLHLKPRLQLHFVELKAKRETGESM